MKRFIKTFLFCTLALGLAIASGSLAYIAATDILKKNPYEKRKETAVGQAPAQSVSASAEIGDGAFAAESKEESNVKFNYYTVKLEDGLLNVYVNYDKHEELLYGEKINITDLSENDKELLQNGVRLEEMSKVTELTENFTS